MRAAPRPNQIIQPVIDVCAPITCKACEKSCETQHTHIIFFHYYQLNAAEQKVLIDYTSEDKNKSVCSLSSFLGMARVQIELMMRVFVGVIGL